MKAVPTEDCHARVNRYRECMKLFLLRHAAAEYGGPDPDRPLSEAGERVASQLARFVHSRRYFSFKEIWCSPYLRARQTAAPFLEHLPKNASIEYREALVPHADPTEILPELLTRKKALLLVGHNPHLSNLVHYLLGIRHDRYSFPFKKGALFVFKREPLGETGYTLSAYLPPSALGLKG